MQYLYQIKNIKNSKFYVGRTFNIDKRWNNHRNLLRKNQHHCLHLQRAWNKYGEENFVFNVIEVFNNHSKEENLYLVKEKEQEYLDKYFSTGLIYNSSVSSETGVTFGENHFNFGKHPSEWMGEGYFQGINKLKLMTGSKNHFYGKKHSKKTIEVLRKKCAMFGKNNPFYGKKHTQESLKKMKIAKNGMYDGEKNPFFGKRHSEETKAIISKKNKGKLKGVPKSEEQVKKMRNNSPKNTSVVINGVEYISISEASRSLNIDRKTISYRIKSSNSKFSGYNFI